MIVSWPADSLDTVHASRHSAATPAAMRTHRHRQAATAAMPAAPTQPTPSRPDGTVMEAPGTCAAHPATRSSHHNSGPVNRINSCPPDGHWGQSAAAAVPTTVGPDKPPKYPTTYYTDYMTWYQKRNYDVLNEAQAAD